MDFDGLVPMCLVYVQRLMVCNLHGIFCELSCFGVLCWSDASDWTFTAGVLYKMGFINAGLAYVF